MSDTDPVAQRFSFWRGTGHRALIPYLTAGYPTPGDTVRTLHALADVGADVLELGIPFSDPVADGPTTDQPRSEAGRRPPDSATLTPFR